MFGLRVANQGPRAPKIALHAAGFGDLSCQKH
jgi:hypothetical protein